MDSNKHMAFITVTKDENESGIALALEKNGNLLKVDSVLSAFPDSVGLAYRNIKSGEWNEVEKKNENFEPPNSGWDSQKIVVITGKKIKFKLNNLDSNMTEKMLKEYFNQFGILEEVKISKKGGVGHIVIRFISDKYLMKIKEEQKSFTLEELDHPALEKFSKRSGSTNLGHKFEELTIASLLLNLTLDESVRDFNLSSNDEEFGNFDDIVVDVELTNGGKRKYAIQLKYSSDGQLKKAFLTSTKGGFSISKYLEGFLEMIEFTKSYNLILFTNLKCNITDEEILHLENSNIKLTTVKQELPKEFGSGCCFKFHPTHFKISQQQEWFFENFLLCSNQPNIRKMEENILEQFRFEFSCNSIYNYLKFITEWNNRTHKRRLDKNFTKEMLALQILETSIKSLPFVEKEDDVNTKLFKKAALCFNVTVIEPKYLEKITKMWENETVSTGKIEEIINDLHLKNLSDDHKRAVVLWIMNKCPLILIESDTVYKVIHLCQEKFFIILKNPAPFVNLQNLKIFITLANLKRVSMLLYEKIVKTFRCSLQGKNTLVLEELIAQNKHFDNIITVSKLTEMLNGPLIIGKQETVLNIYIERSVTRLIVDYAFLDAINRDTLVIISCQGKFNKLQDHLKMFDFIDVEDYLKDEEKEISATKVKQINLEKTIYVSKHECDQETIDAIRKKNTSRWKYHHFRLVEEGILEWIFSNCEINDLQNYKSVSRFVHENDLINDELRKVNIITADPGMGKTEFMKKLSNSYPAYFWTVFIPAKDWSDYLKHEDYSNQNFIENVAKTCKTDFEKEVLRTMYSSKKVAFLWDGLDELSNTELNCAIKIIDELYKNNFIQWISCRRRLGSRLEKKFNVLSRTIAPFDKNEQKIYIQRRLNDTEINIEEMIDKIMNYMNNVQCSEILGTPLQIFMITELLLKNPTKCKTFLSDFFSVTKLYRYFIEMKFKIYIEEKVGLKNCNSVIQEMTNVFYNELIKFHQKEALSIIIIENEYLKYLNFDSKSGLSESTIYGMGIITGKTHEGKAKFLHFSYAEYFVALYFYNHRKKLKSLIKEIIFKDNYRNVRFMFDLLLAENSPTHLAVLYNNIEYLQRCEDYACKDKGGRNLLQIACSWSPRFPFLNVVQQANIYLIDYDKAELINDTPHFDEMLNLLLNYNSITEKDLLFGINSIQYADLSLSFKTLVLLLKKQYFVCNSLEKCKDFHLFYYSVIFDYHFVLNYLHNIPVLKTNKNYNTLHLGSLHNSINCLQVLLSKDNYRKYINEQNLYGETPIFLACEKGYYEVVDFLAQSAADINIPQQNGYLPLHIASKNGHLRIIKLLVDLKCKVNATTKDGGLTSIYLAAQEGHYETVKYLAQSGADVNAPQQNGFTPIHIAALKGDLEVVKLLTNLKCEVNVRSKEGFTPIYNAAQEGHYEVVKYLLESEADVNITEKDGFSPIHVAAYKGHIDIIKLLIGFRDKVNKRSNRGMTPVYSAAENGHYEIIEYLTEFGADVNIPQQNGFLPIHIATLNGHVEVVKLFTGLMYNLNVKNNEGSTPLYLATERGHYEIVKYLIESEADVNMGQQDGFTPIHVAALKGHINILNLLTHLATDVNARNNKGFTPIYYAAQENHYESVKLLAESGADVNIPQQNGFLPIHIAALKGYFETVKLLIHLKSDINVETSEGFTPIYNATQEGHYEIVKYLAELGADVNIPQKDDFLPIHIASLNGHIKIVKLLVNLKSDVNAKTNKGLTPIYLAAQEGHYDVVEYLADSKADVNIPQNKKYIPIHVAARNGHIQVVELLTNLKVDLNAKADTGATPVYLAAQEGYYSVVKYLAKLGADVNIPKKNGYTSLHIAAKKGHFQTIKVLLDGKADLNAKNGKMFTPINLAAQEGHCKIVKYLASSGADVNISQKDGLAPIHFAALRGDTLLVKLLIDLKVELDARTDEGFTPIYLAAQEGHYKVVKCLVESGTNVDLPLKNGYTPKYIARRKGHVEIVKLLTDLKGHIGEN